MSDNSSKIFKTVEFKLYPNAEQAHTLTNWLRRACWVYNQALEHRIKAYKRRKESVNLYAQAALLVSWRRRMPSIRDLPSEFARSALRRVDRGFKSFFRRVREGARAVGFPRFRSRQRYNSLECLASNYYIGVKTIVVPKLGAVTARGPFRAPGRQKLLRLVRRAGGWYAQVLLEQDESPSAPLAGGECGLDLGLESFLTLDSGESAGNPRLLRKATRKLRTSHRRLSRRQKGSNRYLKAKQRLRRIYEAVSRKRRGFCHRVSRDLINRFDRIALEDLNIKSLAMSKFSKSILDAAWGLFVFFLTYKAANAGRVLVKVDPRGTSQECPNCGRVVRKQLSERSHHCVCGLKVSRDQASAMVIRNRAFRRKRGDPVRPAALELAGSAKRDGTG